MTIAGDRDGRLRVRAGVHPCAAHTVAVAAVAIPLRESPTRGGTYDMYSPRAPVGRKLLPPPRVRGVTTTSTLQGNAENNEYNRSWSVSTCRNVHRDLETEPNIFECWFSPSHKSLHDWLIEIGRHTMMTPRQSYLECEAAPNKMFAGTDFVMLSPVARRNQNPFRDQGPFGAFRSACGSVPATSCKCRRRRNCVVTPRGPMTAMPDAQTRCFAS